MRINSSDLLGTAFVQARVAAEQVEQVRRDNPPNTLAQVDQALEMLASALADLRIARHGIARGNPGFDSTESDALVDSLRDAISKGVWAYLPN